MGGPAAAIDGVVHEPDDDRDPARPAGAAGALFGRADGAEQDLRVPEELLQLAEGVGVAEVEGAEPLGDGAGVRAEPAGVVLQELLELGLDVGHRAQRAR